MVPVVPVVPVVLQLQGQTDRLIRFVLIGCSGSRFSLGGEKGGGRKTESRQEGKERERVSGRGTAHKNGSDLMISG